MRDSSESNILLVREYHKEILMEIDILVGCVTVVMGSWNRRSQQIWLPLLVPIPSQDCNGCTLNDVINPGREKTNMTHTHKDGIITLNMDSVRNSLPVKQGINVR